MVGSILFRFVAALAPAVASTMIVGEPDITPNLSEIASIRVEQPIVASGLVVVPLVFEETDGSTSSLNVPLEPKLVDTIRLGFGSEARLVLSSLENAVTKGLGAKREDIRAASASVLPYVQDAVPFRVLEDLPMSDEVEQKVADIAQKIYDRSGTRVVVTSGTRCPERQAEAMRVKLQLGESPTQRYGNKEAAGEIELAYYWAKKTGLDVTATIATVIQRQIDRGIYISNHLRAGAVDLRSRDLTAEQRRVVVEAAQEEGAHIMLESTPPHFHLDVL